MDGQAATLPRARRDAVPAPAPPPQRVRIADPPPPRRPLSLYDNLQRGGSGSICSAAVSTGNLAAAAGAAAPMDRSPSQANCLSTTVPQNIAATSIAGRHTPSRTSLRHSRMIVLSRAGKVPRKYHPPVLRHHRLATALAALQVLLGVAVSSLAVWLLVWAPNLRVRDIPYWSGLPLLVSGVLGLMLMCCCRKDYPGMPLGVWMFSLKVMSVCLAVVAGVACFCACVFALLHLVFLSSMACEPAHVLNATCVCQDAVRTYHYTDLNCPEVGNILTILLIGSCAANGIGGILATWYVFLHWSSRYAYLYSEVKTSENKPIVFSNEMEMRK